jgi:hypothetical protein
MNLSLISFHMILVISSPSSSTNGLLTLILSPPLDISRSWPPLMRRPSADSRVEARDMCGEREDGVRTEEPGLHRTCGLREFIRYFRNRGGMRIQGGSAGHCKTLTSSSHNWACVMIFIEERCRGPVEPRLQLPDQA